MEQASWKKKLEQFFSEMLSDIFIVFISLVKISTNAWESKEHF